MRRIPERLWSNLSRHKARRQNACQEQEKGGGRGREADAKTAGTLAKTIKIVVIWSVQ